MKRKPRKRTPPIFWQCAACGFVFKDPGTWAKWGRDYRCPTHGRSKMLRWGKYEDQEPT